MSQQQTTPVNDGNVTETPQTADETNHAEHERSDAVSNQDETLAAVRREAQVNLEGWQRTLAEFQNYKRRTEREVKDTYQNATLDTIIKILPVIDDFERAMANIPADLEGNAWINGVTLIQRKLSRLLEDHNVTVIDPVGEPFDPNRHQAIGTDEDSDAEAGQVTTTLQKGYIAGDRILRPAIVKIAG